MKSPILLDIPETFESQRLKMRCPMPGDGAEVYDAESETYDQLKQWFSSWAKEPSSLEQTEERMRKCRIEFLERTLLSYNCYLKEDNTLAGRAWFTRFDWSIPKAHFALWVRSNFQAGGLGMEIALAITLFGLEQIGLKRIESYVDPRNKSSRKLFEKLGYYLEGTMRNYSFDNFGVMRDYLVYSIIPADLDAFKARHKEALASEKP
jgi:RimJ/RimL family protein N-acetyltransferase